jgi:hypothetical protein
MSIYLNRTGKIPIFARPANLVQLLHCWIFTTVVEKKGVKLLTVPVYGRLVVLGLEKI